MNTGSVVQGQKKFLELARITEALFAVMNDFTVNQAVDNMAGNFSYLKWFELPLLTWYWILSARVQCSICGRWAKAPLSSTVWQSKHNKGALKPGYVPKYIIMSLHQLYDNIYSLDL